MTVTAKWTPCPDCDNYWCNKHQMHAHDCPCPSVDEMDDDPYGDSDDNGLGGNQDDQ